MSRGLLPLNTSILQAPSGTAAGSVATSAVMTRLTRTGDTSPSTSPSHTRVSACLSSCQSISLYLIIIGFPFLVMGVCYGLIYYKVIILLHFPPLILMCSSPSSDASFQTQFGRQGCNCFQPPEEAQKLYQNVVFYTIQVSSHYIL